MMPQLKIYTENISQVEEFRNFNLDSILKYEYKPPERLEIDEEKDLFFYQIDVNNGVINNSTLPDDITLLKDRIKEVDSFNPFVNINKNVNDELYILYFPEKLDRPVRIINRIVGDDTFVTSNIRYSFSENSKIDILEETYCDDSCLIINNREFEIGNSVINYSRNDVVSNKSNLIYNYNGNVDTGCLNSVSIFRNGSISLNIWDINLDKDGAECYINSVIDIDEEKRHGTICKIRHNSINSISSQEIRHVLDGRSYAMYDGDSIIDNRAKDSRTSQYSKTIMLSPESRIYNKPRLNIYTGEVKAEHGATIGKLNPEDVFYLQQRGLPESLIKKILVDAFVNDILDKIPSEKIREVFYDKR